MDRPLLARDSFRDSVLWLCAILLFLGAAATRAQVDANEPGILEPMTSALLGTPIRVPNTDQSVDGEAQSTIVGDVVFEDAYDGQTSSMLGHPITRVESPNEDMRLALQAMARAAESRNSASLSSAAEELLSILLGTTAGRIYDGFSMLNYNRWQNRDETGIGPEHFAQRDGQLDVLENEYKMKWARDTGETFTSPFDGETRRIWEVNVNMLYYDFQIDSDTFLVRFPVDAHPDDTLRVHYRVFSLVQEDFSPTLVMLDRRLEPSTVNFPFKGFDAVWIAFFPGEVLNVTVAYPPIRMVRGVYTWGWREHPPRIQFLQPVYDIVNQHTGEAELDPQGISFAVRNRDDLTLDTIADAAPEMKMYRVARAALAGTDLETLEAWLTEDDEGPRGTWFEWAELAREQRQLPPEAQDILDAEDGLGVGEFGDYNMVSVYMNNEMYGDGPFGYEINTWEQGDTFRVKLINLDKHTHYFRNVDFSARQHDDIARCCGGGLTSFEIMNFKPSYGAPKVAEMQWRAGWGFRPHYDVVQQQAVFPRSIDRLRIEPYTDGDGDTFFGYQYSEEARGGDFRFNPPPFVITDTSHPAEFPLRESDGSAGLLIGRRTEGYGTGQVCPDDPYPGFCSGDIAAFNPHGSLNWPPPPLQGAVLADGTVLPSSPTELRFPPFLRNPEQGASDAGDIIPPTASWRPFLWINPNNGTLFNDPDDPSQGYWADGTFSHGAPVFAGQSRVATVELPRAAGQVFYQFDDLFHDNSIFSPHPVFEGFEELDEGDSVSDLRASRRGDSLRVQGRLSELETGDAAEWVAVFAGSAGAERCSGDFLGSAEVHRNGRFVFRQADTALTAGSSVCVQSGVGAFAGTTVQ